jgi:hypothetical protein
LIFNSKNFSFVAFAVSIVKNHKQAIAVIISEARHEGNKVPKEKG